MSHTTSIKRRLGAALTSFVTAAALVVPLASPAFADHSTGVGLISTEFGTEQNGPSGASHLTVTVPTSPALARVVFAADCDADIDGVFEIAIGTDTAAPYEASWNTAAIPDGTSCRVRATAFRTAGGSVEDIDDVTVRNDVPGVEITNPAHGGALAYYAGPDNVAVVTGELEAGEGTQSLEVFYDNDTPGEADPDESSCGTQDPVVDVDGDATNGIQFAIACTGLASDTNIIYVEAYDSDTGESSMDAHAVTAAESDPEFYTVSIDPAADSAAAGTVCNEYTVTVIDADGNAVAGVNLDVQAAGPDDDLVFATTLNTSKYTASDAAGLEEDRQSTADCTLDGEGDVFEGGDYAGGVTPPGYGVVSQAVIVDPDDLDPLEPGSGDFNDPDEADIKQIEGSSNAVGQFTFAIFSQTDGTTAITAWADTFAENDLNDEREREGSATKTWYDAVPDSLVIDPAVGFNNQRTDHTITATLLDQNGNPFPAAQVELDITAGPNDTGATNTEFDDLCVTDGLGMCSVVYTDTLSSDANGYTDTIFGWVNGLGNPDPTAGPDASEPQATVTKTWINVDDACLDASPEYGLNAYDAVHTILVTVRATDGIADGVCTGEPIENATVNASILRGDLDAALSPDVDGDEDNETLLTDANGQVSVDLTQATSGEAEGWNTVEFVLDGVTPASTFYGNALDRDSRQNCEPGWDDFNCQRQRDDDNNNDYQNENAFDSVDKEWAVPGRPYDLTLLPRYSSNELGTAHTVTATVTDAFGTPVVGDEVTIEVYSGPNAGDSTVCTTNASGSCSFTYTDALAVDGDQDQIRATASNGRTGWAYKYWYTDAEADAIAIDMEWQCNPNLGAGFGVDDDDCDSWELDANPNEVDTGHWLVASAKSGAAATGDVLYGEEITFTISGVGEFVEREYDDETDEWSWISLGTTVSTPISGNGYAAVQINSTAVGESTVNASIDDQSIDGTKDWYAGDLRNLVFLEPTSIRRTPGTIAEHTAQATDRFGNVVPFWDVCFSETGPGTIRTVQDQFNTNCDETDEDGNITIEVQTNAAESGTQTITAESDEGERYQNRDRDGYFFDCEAFAGETATGGMAAGVPEGNCSDEATVIWSNIGDAVDVDPTDPTEQTIPPGSASCFGGVASDSNGNGVPDQAVGAMLTGANGSVTPTVNTGDCPSGTAGSGTGSGTTDANGVFSATYTPTNSGTDTLRLFVDLNENGAYDDGEPFTDYVLSVEAGGGVDTGDTVRLAGPNRIATALAISGASFADDAAGAVVLARSDDFPDALAGTPLAVAKNAPTLLTESSLQSSTLNSDTRAEIDRVLPSGGTVYILGGTVAVPAGAESELVGAGYTVIRLGGADRYATAILIADAVSLNPDSILITTGTNFPDALAAGSAAVSVSGVIVLSRGTEKASATDAYLARAANADATLFAIGGPSVTAYGASVPDANEIAGATRLSTSINVANRFFSAPTVVGIATMRNFPDALTGGAHIARLGGPLVLVNGDNLAAGLGSQDAGIVQAYLEGDAESIDVAYIYGGTVVVSNFAQLQIDNAITANN